MSLELKRMDTFQIRGVSALARRVGRTSVHVGRVLRCERKAGPELREALEREGIKFDKDGMALFNGAQEF